MEKKKKNKFILNLLATVATVSALLGTFATFASASDVSISTTQYDRLVPYVDFNSIEFRGVKGSNIAAANANFIVESPFVFYDYGFDDQRGGKFGVVLNYPVQTENFTSNGRTLYFDFITGIENNSKVVHASTPITYADPTALPNNIANSKEVILSFDEIIFMEGQRHYFDFSFDRVSISGYNSKLRVEFDVLSYDHERNVYVSDSLSAEWFNIDSFSVSSDTFEDLIGLNDGSAVIQNLKFVYNPFVDSNGVPLEPSMPNASDYVRSLDFNFTCINEGFHNLYRRIWYEENRIVEKEFIGIGDVSFVDWLIVAVGGFFDFEIMPNVSLGGLLLLGVSVGVVMLLIRIFRG